MTQKNKNGVVYLSFPELERIAGLRHLFSTRKGGVSRGEFSQMNFS
ncbi:MAG: laccase domain-containing protein, partial [Lachnospiraceae bacterium]|nr:laccase domain-containing protein [Lachnospiraceae bacterium]